MSRYVDPRPCERGWSCVHEAYDWSECCPICDIDFDGDSCPYIKPYGHRKYEQENGGSWEERVRYEHNKRNRERSN